MNTSASSKASAAPAGGVFLRLSATTAAVVIEIRGKPFWYWRARVIAAVRIFDLDYIGALVRGGIVAEGRTPST